MKEKERIKTEIDATKRSLDYNKSTRIHPCTCHMQGWMDALKWVLKNDK
jgi:hypothetical protein